MSAKTTIVCDRCGAQGLAQSFYQRFYDLTFKGEIGILYTTVGDELPKATFDLYATCCGELLSWWITSKLGPEERAVFIQQAKIKPVIK